MNPVIILATVAVLLALRIWRRRRRLSAPDSATRRRRWTPRLGDVGLVAAREVRERLRGRVLRVGTLVILAAVAAAIVIPVLHGKQKQLETVGVVGTLAGPLRSTVLATGSSIGSAVHIVPEADLAAAHRALRAGGVDLLLVDGRTLVVKQAIDPTDTSTTARFVRTLADVLGVQGAYRAAGLSPAQARTLAGAKPLDVVSLESSPQGAARTTSVVGVILVFVMLTQYNTWILIGVMEEKSSRVVEVLLGAVRPVQLLAGKVLGIGLVALAQAALIVGFALGLAKAVGSDLLSGTAPVELASALLWLVLGYAFYCWVYAAAGATVERQEQVQSLAFPLSIPLLLGYILALIVAGTGNPTTFFWVLAYLPPTAPFAMPVLVGLDKVTPWEFAASAALSVVATVAVARLAATIYRRAILRTGGRVRLRDIFSGHAA